MIDVSIGSVVGVDGHDGGHIADTVQIRLQVLIPLHYTH